MEQLLFSIPPEARSAYLQQIHKQSRDQVPAPAPAPTPAPAPPLSSTITSVPHQVIFGPEPKATTRKRRSGLPRKCTNPSCDRIVTKRNFCFKCQKRKERGLALNPKLPSVKQILLPSCPNSTALEPTSASSSMGARDPRLAEASTPQASKAKSEGGGKKSKSKTVASILASSRAQTSSFPLERDPTFQPPLQKVPKLGNLNQLRSAFDTELPSIYSLIPPESPRNSPHQNYFSFANQQQSQQKTLQSQQQTPQYSQHVQQLHFGPVQPQPDQGLYPFQQNQQHTNTLDALGNRCSVFSTSREMALSPSTSSSSVSSSSSDSSLSPLPFIPSDGKLFAPSFLRDHWHPPPSSLINNPIQQSQPQPQSPSSPRVVNKFEPSEMSDSHPPSLNNPHSQGQNMLEKLHDAIMQITEGDDELAIRLAFEYFSLRTRPH